jgi:hypothetical protein
MPRWRSKMLSDIAQGLIELTEDVSHDPDEADWYDVDEYLSNIPNSSRVLKELVRYIHSEYL